MYIDRKKFDLFIAEYSAYFFVSAIILSLAFFIFLSNIFRYSVSETTVLFIPKSERTAVQAELIAKNMALLPKSLSFYEKILADNPNMKDSFEGESRYEKKKGWDKMLKTRVKDNSTIISISVQSGKTADSEKLSKQVAYTLFDSYAKYYDVKTDIDFRIIDGPITKSGTRYAFLVILMSLFLGTSVSYFIFSVISGKIAEYLNENAYAKFSFPKFLKAEENDTEEYGSEEGVMEEMILERKEAPRTKEAVKYVSAPANLPVGEIMVHDETENIQVAPENLPAMIEEEKEETVLETSGEREEPTADDYKRRLNQLLRGEL